MKPELSIIIVNWNTKECLRSCLKSIYGKVVNVSFEIIIVDNVSTDGSQKMVKKEFPEVKLMINKENVGFGRACNQAAKEAMGGYLLILNPDTEIIEVDFQVLFRFFKERDKIGAVIPIAFSADGSLKYKTIHTLPTPVIIFSHTYPKLRWQAYKPSQPLSLTEVQEHQYPSGFCFLMRTSTFKELKGFDDRFFLYLEDTDLGVRLELSGLKIVSYPEFKIIHAGGKASSQDLISRDLSWHKSAIYFFRKTAGIKGYVLMKILLLVGATIDLVYILVEYLLRNKSRNSWGTTIFARLKIFWWHISNLI